MSVRLGFRAHALGGGSAAGADGCALKGNISHQGCIYHMPWDAFYDGTRIDPARGERWFCDENEARRAGWRPAAG